MKLPDFDHTKMEWDSWQAFHVEHKFRTFIQFDTGEFVVCHDLWRPDHRHVYTDLHIQIAATDDKDCPRLYIPGTDKPVPKSHLNHKGQQILLLDLDHKRAVSLLHGSSKHSLLPVPARFASPRVTAWYAGPEAMPVGAPITRHYPAPLIPCQREHIKELTDACKVWLEMQPDPDTLKHEHRGITVPVLDCLDVSFSVLTTEHRVAIAMRGFNMIVKESHPWLTFNVEGETEHDSKDD